MAGEKQNEVWPLAKFYFQVNFGNMQTCNFQEVSGLETDTQIIEYRHSSSKQFSTVKMPGIAKFGNVTLKKGILKKDDIFLTWYNQIKLNTIKRISVVIKLLDENGNATMSWTLANAWPTKIVGNDIKSVGNEISVELIELVHEGLTVKNLL